MGPWALSCPLVLGLLGHGVPFGSFPLVLALRSARGPWPLGCHCVFTGDVFGGFLKTPLFEARGTVS